MVRTSWFVVGMVCALVGCSKREGNAAVGAASATAPAIAAASAMSAAAASPAPAASSIAPAEAKPEVKPEAAATVASEAPSSFAGGTKENIEGAVGQGCEARSAQGWLEFLCRKKNGTGGHPVRAILDAENNQEVLADEHGELKLTLPYNGNDTKDVTIEWSDTRYVLRLKGASGKLEWSAGGLELRRACARVQDASKARLSEAQKLAAPAAVTAAEAAKLPRFGVCQQAGFGSYAVGLKSLAADGEGSERKLKASLEVMYVSDTGAQRSAELGSFEFFPGGFTLSPLRVYDYDDDGKDELIVAYELTAAPESEAAPPAVIWSLTDSSIVPYAKSPTFGRGGVAIEQLDFDMRPDLGDYGPYVAMLTASCGAKNCPPRITGPRFFFHSLPDGGFARDDSAAKAALKRACSKKPEPIVVESAGVANVVQTAKNVACASAWGVPGATISTELAGKRGAVCGTNEACPLLAALEKWAGSAPPVTLAQ
ncbi:MAG: hypothetical protein ACOY0T_20570 [Myxococcota bacterium]